MYLVAFAACNKSSIRYSGYESPMVMELKLLLSTQSLPLPFLLGNRAAVEVQGDTHSSIMLFLSRAEQSSLFRVSAFT